MRCSRLPQMKLPQRTTREGGVKYVHLVEKKTSIFDMLCNSILVFHGLYAQEKRQTHRRFEMPPVDDVLNDKSLHQSVTDLDNMLTILQYVGII